MKELSDKARKIGLSILGLSTLCLIFLNMAPQISDIKNKNNLKVLKITYQKMDSIKNIKNSLPKNTNGGEEEEFNLAYLNLKYKADSIYNLLPKNYQEKADSLYKVFVK